MANNFSNITKQKHEGVLEALKGQFGYTNPMQAPRLLKLVVTSGIGSVSDKNKRALIANRLAKITGQKVADRTAKKSIATYKTRQGDLIGYQVTLRGDRMWSFVDKLLHIAFPRTRDFRGIKTTGFDEMGNYSFGIKEHTIFPEAADEDIKDIFGIGITVVTSAKTKAESEALLRHLGFPFERESSN
ncbi:MAG: 50S ribosomal protein L5 [Candidatus Pacebacteria bacterium]|nr:50S ribosomal protein L5 [Candidatus Paceibacterota bacterium]